jgi:ribosome maturation factor RimP
MTILKCCSLIARGLRAIFFGEELAALDETLKELALPLAEARNMFLAGILIRQVQKRQIIQIFADTDSGISIGECAEFSRTLADIIEERNLIDGPYELEVSSPGLEQPLISIRQYRRNIGRPLKVRYTESGEVKNAEGILETVSEKDIVLLSGKNDRVSVEFEKIVETTVQLPW